MPALDVKVVPADENRFGTGHGFNTSPSAGTPGGDRQPRPSKILAKAQLLAGVDLGTGRAASGTTARSSRGDRVAHDRRPRALRPRLRRAAARRRGRARRPDRLPRLMRPTARTTATLTVHTGAAARRPRPATTSTIVVSAGARRSTDDGARRSTADSRSLRVRRGHAAASRRSATRRRPAIAQTIDEEVLKGAPIDPLDRVARASAERQRRLDRRPTHADRVRRRRRGRSRQRIVKQTDWRIKPYSALFGTLRSPTVRSRSTPDQGGLDG